MKVDRRKGAIISVDIDKLQAIEELRRICRWFLPRADVRRYLSRKYMHSD